MYSLFLGFLATGAAAYQKMTEKDVDGLSDITCRVHFLDSLIIFLDNVESSTVVQMRDGFAVGFIMYGRFFSGKCFHHDHWYYHPSSICTRSKRPSRFRGSSESGFQTVMQLISIAVGPTAGLGISLFLAYPIQSSSNWKNPAFNLKLSDFYNIIFPCDLIITDEWIILAMAEWRGGHIRSI
ncbi:hypothetical protein L218DRAFT_942877 [Marasmius fiardii PR-910]|nr:hypothetical protein L218DRAFT_942877 [Marasmius fiardii PR-910]